MLTAEEIQKMIADSLAEQSKQNSELIDSRLGQVQSVLASEFAKQLTGATGRLKKELGGDLSTQVQEAMGGITEQLQLMQQAQPPAQQQQEPAQQQQQQPPADTSADSIQAQIEKAMAAERTKYQQQLQAQAQQVDELKKTVTKAEQDKIESDRRAKLSEYESRFASKVGNDVTDPARFFQFMSKVEGVFNWDEDAGRCTVSTGEVDNFGNPVVLDAVDYVPQLLKKPEYANWAKARPGGGSGEQPANGVTPGVVQQKYFGEGSKATASDLVQLMKQGKENLIKADLLGSIQ
jgi:hypothetical protein